MENQSCQCCGGVRLIFACSGASDVGHITDLAARRLTEEGAGRMFCIVGIGGRVDGIMKSTEAAERILAIDGCPLCCVKNSLLNAGFNDFLHIQLEDLGLKKGTSPVNEENIKKVVEKGKELLCK